jgi:hypothetical protein
MTIDTGEWLRLIEHEYVVPFIVAGGAAVKFAVAPDPAIAATALSGLDRIAAAHRLARVSLDAAQVRLHMIQDVFFATAAALDWKEMAQTHVERLFAENGYEWPRPGQAVPLPDLAELYRTDETILRRDFKQWLSGSIMRDASMNQEFRIAMSRLCEEWLAATDGGEDTVTPVLEWLRGELRIISALRSAQIYVKITRHNARSMLRSLCHWLRLCGYRGLVLTLDAARVSQPPEAVRDGVRYAPGAILDAMEVLRQLIDDADHFEGVLVVVLADMQFLNGQPKRSIECYPALKMRIWDDVRDRTRDNPVAPLVTLRAGNDPAGPAHAWMDGAAPAGAAPAMGTGQ